MCLFSNRKPIEKICKWRKYMVLDILSSFLILRSRLKAFFLKIPRWVFMKVGKMILIFIWKDKVPRTTHSRTKVEVLSLIIKK